MRNLMVVAACAVTVASGAAAKGPVMPVVGSVCGASGCVRASGFSLQVAGTPTFYRHVAPAPFVVVRLRVESNDFLVGTDRPIVYAPARGLWRVQIQGTLLWLDVPNADRAVLRRALARVDPYRAPRAWSSVNPRG